MPDLMEDTDLKAPRAGILSVAKLRSDLRTYYLLLCAALVVFVPLALLVIVLKAPSYTATAIVGPANNEDQPLGEGLGGAASLGGIAKHLHVGGMLGQPEAGDTFDEYVSLLTSNRLAEVLVARDHMLPVIFADQWDGTNKRWLPRDDLFHRTVDSLKTLLHRPVKAAPDQDDLIKYLAVNMGVDQSVETSFATVTLKFPDRAKAEHVLSVILLEADNIIRQDKRRDVSARIAYLYSALEHLALADQKPAMIDILSDQQQEMMMIESDHRYASTLIDMPHAPTRPTSPDPIMDLAAALGLAGISWLTMIRLAPARGMLRSFVEAFARPRLSRRRFGGRMPVTRAAE